MVGMATKQTKRLKSIPPVQAMPEPVREIVKNEPKRPVLETNLVLALLLIVAAFFIGRLSAQVEQLKGGGTTTAAQQNTQQTQQQAQQPAQAQVSLAQIQGLEDKKNIFFGDKNRKLTFVEFSDPSCPFCHVASGNDGELNKQMGPQFTLASDGGSYVAPVKEMKKLVDAGKASFIWLYANGHGNGEMGAKALYCANEKGKFWEAHDLIMSQKGYDLMNNTVKNDKTKSGDVATFLKGVVNYNDMKSCLDSGKYDARLTQDMTLAQSMGFQGTPYFFVNTSPIVGAESFKDMESLVDAALK